MHRRRIISLLPGAIVAAGLVLILHSRWKFRHAKSPWSIPQAYTNVPDGLLSHQNVSIYIKAITDPDDRNLPKLDCGTPDLSRYKNLIPPKGIASSQTRFFFALNLRENLVILPQLLGSVLQAMDFLGPQNCALSVVEGNSPDGTSQVLAALEPYLHKLGATHFQLNVSIDPLQGSRFAALAQLRNLALQPLLDQPARYADATVVFANDVAICPEDLLELVYQKEALLADMTCAMDWVYGADNDTSFYDVYISRGITGDLFFDIPAADVSWAYATKLFWNDKESRDRYSASLPVQVFACWNGAVAFAARPVVKKQVTFRAARQDQGECYNGEPEIFCKDLWLQGYGKIAIVPYVHLAYSVQDGARIKKQKGLTYEVLKTKPLGRDETIVWKPPPAKVKCMPEFTNQYWTPWNDTGVS